MCWACELKILGSKRKSSVWNATRWPVWSLRVSKLLLTQRRPSKRSRMLRRQTLITATSRRRRLASYRMCTTMTSWLTRSMQSATSTRHASTLKGIAIVSLATATRSWESPHLTWSGLFATCLIWKKNGPERCNSHQSTSTLRGYTELKKRKNKTRKKTTRSDYLV